MDAREEWRGVASKSVAARAANLDLCLALEFIVLFCRECEVRREAGPERLAE